MVIEVASATPVDLSVELYTADERKGLLEAALGRTVRVVNAAHPSMRPVAAVDGDDGADVAAAGAQATGVRGAPAAR